MTDIGDVLDQAAEESWNKSDTSPQADLVNKIFTIHQVDLKEWEDEAGESRAAYIAQITFAGDDYMAYDYWLGGSLVMGQIVAIEDKLPVTVTLVRDASKRGNPYKLIEAPNQPQKSVPTDTNFRAKFGEFAKANDLDAFKILATLSIDPTEDSRSRLAQWIQDTAQESGCTTDYAYKMLQTKLEAHLTAAKQIAKSKNSKPKPVAVEDLPL